MLTPAQASEIQNLHQKQYSSFLNWVSASPSQKLSAFADFKHKQEILAVKLKELKRDSNADQWGNNIVKIVQQELKGIEKVGTLSQLDPVLDKLSNAIVASIEQELFASLMSAWLGGYGEAMRDTGDNWKRPPATDLWWEENRDIVQRMMDSDVTKKALEGIREGSYQIGRQVIEDAYAFGQVDLWKITRDIADKSAVYVAPNITRIVHTETFKVWETARMMGYMESERRRGEKFIFQFGTIDDTKTCEICKEIMRRTIGGVYMEDLVRIVVQTSKEKMGPKWDPTAGGGFPVPHPGCRHRHFRLVRHNV